MSSFSPSSSLHAHPLLLGVFFAEFHPTQGPRIAFQAPSPSVDAVASQWGPSGGASSATTGVPPSPPSPRPPTPPLPTVAAALAATAAVPPASAAPGSSQPPPSPSAPAPGSAGIFRASAGSPHLGDDQAGPAAPAAPPGALPQGVFDKISEYVIPKPQLCGRVVTLRVDGVTLLGLPALIQDNKYERNALIFNLVFVLPEGADTYAHELLLRKATRILKLAEIEDGLLIRPALKSRLGDVLSQIFYDLNQHGSTTIDLTSSHTLHLKLPLRKLFPVPPLPQDHDVPVFIRALPGAQMPDIRLDDLQPDASLAGTGAGANFPAFTSAAWDLTSQKVIPLINGQRTIRAISHLSDCDAELVAKCVQHLVFYDFVVLTDLFQYSNTYVATPFIRQFFGSLAAAEQCLLFAVHPRSHALVTGWLEATCAGPANGDWTPLTAQSQAPLHAQQPSPPHSQSSPCVEVTPSPATGPVARLGVFTAMAVILSGLHPGRSVAAVANQHADLLVRFDIDIRRLVVFSTPRPGFAPIPSPPGSWLSMPIWGPLWLRS
ncbi:hypothetical protein H696_03513 [Fonticula alba]|uniref:Uncharacterized protein n=1 Tax=Fonticula alba TaxID=691883 RepID=A0A058Z725_FONAL|nr:hypothetical protein H696_03513 [Fonticula alba]KCV70050.1 hypothetical protein H696_03513 [Fonticula alba]|eukprot:XP_009495656.1 hypothetical protein H696_03513 [Fonticula alba]